MRFLILGIYHCAFDWVNRMSFPLQRSWGLGLLFASLRRQKLHAFQAAWCLTLVTAHAWRGLGNHIRQKNQGRRKSLNFESCFWVAVLIFDDVAFSMLLMITLRLREPRSHNGPRKCVSNALICMSSLLKLFFNCLNANFVLQTWELYQ